MFGSRVVCLSAVAIMFFIGPVYSVDREIKAKNVLVEMLAERFLAGNKFLRDNSYTKKELEKLFSALEMPKSSGKGGGKKFTDDELREIYRKNFLHEYGYGLGRRYLKDNADILQAAEEKYGVSQEVITAILWVESGFGANMGDSKVLNALFKYSMRGILDPQSMKVERAAEWRAHLAYFLAWCKREHRIPSEVRGSYAGAMGIPQFMPISYIKLARDGDNDGKIDLFASHADAIMSIANYLAESGFKRDRKKAVHAYNHEDPYVETIFKYADHIKNTEPPPAP